MRNLDCNQGNIRGAVLCRHDRSNFLVGLKLDDQIHFFAYEKIRVALSDLGIVLVVYNDQLDALGGGRPLQTMRSPPA